MDTKKKLGRPTGVYDRRRDREVQRFRKQGKTLQQIGNLYGVSRQRIHQILHRKGS